MNNPSDLVGETVTVSLISMNNDGLRVSVRMTGKLSIDGDGDFLIDDTHGNYISFLKTSVTDVFIYSKELWIQ